MKKYILCFYIVGAGITFGHAANNLSPHPKADDETVSILAASAASSLLFPLYWSSYFFKK